MNLKDLYATDGRQGLLRLASAAGCNDKYLWQCATGRREPSPALARRLVAADPRLTIAAIFGASSGHPDDDQQEAA